MMRVLTMLLLIMMKKVDSELNDENDSDDQNDDENENDNDYDDDCPRYQLLLKDLSSSSTNALTGRWLHTYKPDFK